MTDEEQKRRGISDEDRKFIEEREKALKSNSKNEVTIPPKTNSSKSNFWDTFTGADRRKGSGRFN